MALGKPKSTEFNFLAGARPGTQRKEGQRIPLGVQIRVKGRVSDGIGKRTGDQTETLGQAGAKEGLCHIHSVSLSLSSVDLISVDLILQGFLSFFPQGGVAPRRLVGGWRIWLVISRRADRLRFNRA